MFRCFIIILILNKVHTYMKPPDQNLEEISANQCLYKLATMYYHNNRSITIAYHPNFGTVDSVRSFIPLLQSQSNWMLKIRSSNKYYQKLYVHLIQRTSTFQFIHFLDSERIPSSLISPSNHWLLDIKAWQPHQATFLIVSFEIVPNSTRIREIFKELRKRNMFRVLLLIRTVEGATFNMYIFKAVTQNCQITSGRLMKIDSCAFGKLNKGTVLSLKNTDFKNCTIRAGYFEAPPYVKLKRASQIGNSNESTLSKPILEGLEVQLLNVVTAHLGYKVIYTESKIMGDVWKNLSTFGNFQRLESAEVDIILGSYTKTYSRYLAFDTTSFYIQDSLSFCVPNIVEKTNNYEHFFYFTQCLVVIFWVTVIISIVFWISSMLLPNNKHFRDYLLVALTFVRIMTNVAHNRKIYHLSSRLCMAIALIFAFYMNNVYSSQTTSNLVKSKYERKYGSIDKIFEQNLTTTYGPNCINYFQGDDTLKFRNRWNDCYHYYSCLHNVAFNRNTSYSTAILIMKYITKNFVNHNNEPLVYCFDISLMKFTPTMYTNRGAFFIKKFNNIISKLRENGIVLKWINDMLSKNKDDQEVYAINLYSDEDDMIRMKHLVPLFKAILYAYSFSTLVFLCEIGFGYLSNTKMADSYENKQNKLNKLWDEVLSASDEDFFPDMSEYAPLDSDMSSSEEDPETPRQKIKIVQSL
ncbi:unnamed protein product [Diabrotica balteata]|uniref:Uncharacterized protein n=1 Tax=Diabrotica balteata TaxID=107213 RepID=A0A9N9XHB8_DIABA|nr:unnamed protein product [Diabrotica balteata]